MAQYFATDEAGKDGARTRRLAQLEAISSAPVDGHDRDAYILAKSGKKQVLKRRFGLFSMVGLATATMTPWESVIYNLQLGLQNGGPAGVIYGLLICWVGALSIFLALGELSSMIPTAGGQYHWASVLASPSMKAPLSYITGWVTVATWIAGPTTGGYLGSTLMLELIGFLHPTYTPQPYQAMLLMWAILALAVFINALLSSLLPAIELLFLALHVIGFFAVLIPMVALGPHGNARDFFTTFQNLGGWSSQSLSFFVGIQGSCVVMLGTDCNVHMSEEVVDADINVARSMALAVGLNGALAFAMAVVFLYVAGPFDALLQSQAQYPFINIIDNATKSKGATATLVGLIIAMVFASTLSGVASASRMVWSFARDQGLPLSSYIRRINKRRAIPMTAIFVVSICSGLLGIIQLGSTVVFEDVTSLLVVGFFSSYLCVLIPLLYHRIKGNISDEPTDFIDPDTGERKYRKPYKWGRWRLKGTFGTVNNIVAIVYSFVMAFFSFWPPTKQVDARTMNYSSLLLGGVAILSALYYVLWARKTYSGPITEVRTEETWENVNGVNGNS